MQQYQKPLTSVLVKPAGPDCNMKCEYCFYLEKYGIISIVIVTGDIIDMNV